MKIYFFLLTLLFYFNSFSQVDTSIILSEVMFYPESGPNEFIELYNKSEIESIDLTDFKFLYQTSNPDLIIETNEGMILLPQSFAVIFEGDYDFDNGIYNDLIPPEVLILKIDNNSFGTSGMANTSDRTVHILNANDDTISVYNYTANNNESFSDEKIILNRNNAQSNWANGITSNGTPGFRNSITPFSFDLTVASLSFLPEILIEGDNVDITAKVKNSGLENADNYTINIYNDLNFDSLGTQNEIIFSQDYFNLSSGDSVTAQTTMMNLEEGDYQIITEVAFNEDENISNNKLVKEFIVFPPGNIFNDIVINEIMYAPASDEPEWIEIFNRTSEPINLKQWTVADNTDEEIITEENIFIETNSFIVLSEDSTILNFYDIPVEVIVFDLPSLNNSGDAISIKDSLGILIDSVAYFPSWGGSNDRSLERLSVDDESNDEDNWGTSLSPNNATPGKINSLTPKEFDLAITDFVPENEFGILGEEMSFNSIVKNTGLNTSGSFTISLFNDANVDSIPQQNEFVTEVNGNPLFPGDSTELNLSTTDFSEGINYFIATVETNQDEDSTNNIAFAQITGVEVNEERFDIIVNEFMYAPGSPEPEWIELFNRSTKTINLKNYSVADNNDTVKVISESIILNPDEFFIIADDSSFFDVYEISVDFVIKSFPALNNGGDKIIILDSLNRTIDSLEYASNWGGTNGKSLERIDPVGSSIDSANWATSESRLNATPGFINSVTQKEFDAELVDITFEPPFPLFGDNVSLNAEVFNNGLNTIEFTVQLFEDTNLDSIPDLLLTTTSLQTLPPDAFTTINLNYTEANLQNRKGFYARIISENDQDTTNNFKYETIKPGYPQETIVINEIMYDPEGGEPEWIEIYNTSEDSIDLFEWSINDVVTTPVYGTVNYSVYIPPHSFLVLTDDTSIVNYHRIIPSKIVVVNLPNLNNDADGVVLKDSRGQQIDSVLFSRDWGGEDGNSLERIAIDAPSNLQSNWASSIDLELSTPGRINSVTPKQFDLLIKDISFTPRFPVAGDNVFINSEIFNNGVSTANNFTVEFFIDSNSDGIVDDLLASETVSNLNAGDSTIVQSDNAIQNLQNEILTAVNVIYDSDEDTLNNYAEESVEPGFPVQTLLINEVMYSPNSGEPEWFELVNVSADTLNLKNWQASDILSTPTKSFITNEDLLLPPDEFLIIASDTSFYSLYPEVTSEIQIVNFGTLGNNEDGIIVYDFRDAIIDSLLYDSDWGGSRGYSLERLSLTQMTNDSSNWATSLSVLGSTPGMENSLINIPDYQRNVLVINEIMFEPDTDNSEFVEFYNTTTDSINIGGWQIEDEKGNTFKLSETSFLIPPDEYFILAADSSFVSFYNLQNENNITLTGNSSLGLSNSGELILLKDVKGNIIDSVFYSDGWVNRNINNTNNISLERINPGLDANDPANWSSSVEPIGATPLKQNSIFTDFRQKQANISIEPNPFSPDNDGFEDHTIINYNLTQPVAQVRIKIFDNRGRLVRTLLNNRPGGSSGTVIFDGLGDDGRALRMGIYIVFLEALNENSGVVENIKTTVVVARKLN